ncbi:DUF1330 domain-containing protein [Burkholderia sp. Nafp2/4-1b]|uniref:DUF1330 domain-containing protein n=1 Tax=Burkholderia sp. Nafp2/4-1b TaxID=2116686 RepID=UPI000EF93E44|nr:DUF1330 domain-containing protein [Burkholderia sp. Nafp2/4-1b]RKU00051.1 DUF1330 domain-containing protein [Burkholderia sp. Nafp2/4-1b]
MKAYVIAQIAVDDVDRYKPYAAQVPATIAAYGGRYLIRNGAKHALEGAPPTERIVVLEFPSLERAKEWYTSEAYQSARVIRLSASTGNLFIIEGSEE